jgi:hypothetical protein
LELGFLLHFEMHFFTGLVRQDNGDGVRLLFGFFGHFTTTSKTKGKFYTTKIVIRKETSLKFIFASQQEDLKKRRRMIQILWVGGTGG